MGLLKVKVKDKFGNIKIHHWKSDHPELFIKTFPKGSILPGEKNKEKVISINQIKKRKAPSYSDKFNKMFGV